MRVRTASAPSALLAALSIGLLGALVVGCGGGLYGFDRSYSPYGDEGQYYEQAQSPTYQEVVRGQVSADQVIGWFGVVTAVEGEGESRRVTMSLRPHSERHLCLDETSGSCRVTVSERDQGSFVIETEIPQALRQGGREALGVGSLLRVYGYSAGEPLPGDAEPELRVAYFRHWPRGFYVTTASRGRMRR